MTASVGVKGGIVLTQTRRTALLCEYFAFCAPTPGLPIPFNVARFRVDCNPDTAPVAMFVSYPVSHALPPEISVHVIRTRWDIIWA